MLKLCRTLSELYGIENGFYCGVPNSISGKWDASNREAHFTKSILGEEIQ